MIHKKGDRHIPIKYEKPFEASFRLEAGGPILRATTTGKDVNQVKGRIKKAFPSVQNLTVKAVKS